MLIFQHQRPRLHDATSSFLRHAHSSQGAAKMLIFQRQRPRLHDATSSLLRHARSSQGIANTINLQSQRRRETHQVTQACSMLSLPKAYSARMQTPLISSRRCSTPSAPCIANSTTLLQADYLFGKTAPDNFGRQCDAELGVQSSRVRLGHERSTIFAEVESLRCD